MQVVWFKRDLRMSDHAPLGEAARCGKCLCLYVYEPELLVREPGAAFCLSIHGFRQRKAFSP